MPANLLQAVVSFDACTTDTQAVQNLLPRNVVVECV